ncbi:SRPBCC family protein [Halomonas sp. PR-M31]|uniref:aromatic ring-hydroxylating oxygenase subunit alpha n=1 Tax=Halomonas sp. PR-M31 TaxID=1471202 RepID=UPI0006506BE5|nr:aromatic ring-hydroxylating dioxygenase subunit alpha [Halomonas sp. PR-M31]
MNLIAHSGLNDSLAQAREAATELLNTRLPKFSLPQPLYIDEQIYALDLQEIFEKEWLFAGMTCEIPAKGNFMTLQIGNNPIIILRGDNGVIQGFHNVCRHRGSRLCAAEKGKVAKLVCPYHQWTYELDGRLLFAGDMGKSFNPADYRLKPIHVSTAGGYIFVSLAEEPADNSEFLTQLEHYLAPHQMDNVKVAAQSHIVEEANWKLVVENNRECYHCNGSHPELMNSLLEFDDTEDVRATPAYKTQVARMRDKWDKLEAAWQLQFFGRQNRLTRTPLKDGTSSMTLDGKPACKKLMGNMMDPEMGALRILHLPNSWNHFMADHGVVFRILPLGPQQTLVTTKWLVHKDAVEGVDYDPVEMRKVWDATNLQDRRITEDNQRGINSVAYQPGPYSETFEFGVIDFVDWYSERMLANLSDEAPSLHLARG